MIRKIKFAYLPTRVIGKTSKLSKKKMIWLKKYKVDTLLVKPDEDCVLKVNYDL